MEKPRLPTPESGPEYLADLIERSFFIGQGTPAMQILVFTYLSKYISNEAKALLLNPTDEFRKILKQRVAKRALDQAAHPKLGGEIGEESQALVVKRLIQDNTSMALELFQAIVANNWEGYDALVDKFQGSIVQEIRYRSTDIQAFLRGPEGKLLLEMLETMLMLDSKNVSGGRQRAESEVKGPREDRRMSHTFYYVAGIAGTEYDKNDDYARENFPEAFKELFGKLHTTLSDIVKMWMPPQAIKMKIQLLIAFYNSHHPNSLIGPQNLRKKK